MEQSTINIFLAVLAGAIGWFIRMLWDRQETTRNELAALSITVARECVSPSELANALAGLREDLRYIRDRIDDKGPGRRLGDHG